MPARLDVRGSVFVRGGVAATDMAAAAAGAQVHPGTADPQAILAAGHILGQLDLDPVQMRAIGHPYSVNRSVKG